MVLGDRGADSTAGLTAVRQRVHLPDGDRVAPGAIASANWLRGDIVRTPQCVDRRRLVNARETEQRDGIPFAAPASEPGGAFGIAAIDSVDSRRKRSSAANAIMP